jgi:hypothetical protein
MKGALCRTPNPWPSGLCTGPSPPPWSGCSSNEETSKYFKVFHEPFSVSYYYYSPERRSDRFAGTETKQEYGYGEILDIMLSVGEKPVYFKDMAYHVVGLMRGDFVSRFTNTFIIRDPAPVIASLSRFWPDFTLEEIGWKRSATSSSTGYSSWPYRTGKTLPWWTPPI